MYSHKNVLPSVVDVIKPVYRDLTRPGLVESVFMIRHRTAMIRSVHSYGTEAPDGVCRKANCI
jgi:hypothetical protein